MFEFPIDDAPKMVNVGDVLFVSPNGKLMHLPRDKVEKMEKEVQKIRNEMIMNLINRDGNDAK